MWSGCAFRRSTDDVGEAYRLALTLEVSGPFNIAAEPVIGARPVRFGSRLLRGAAAVTWREHLRPADPGWIDLALGVPLMSVDRARAELGFSPARDSTAALIELLNGLRLGEGGATPPLRADAGGPFRAREFASGIVKRLEGLPEAVENWRKKGASRSATGLSTACHEKARRRSRRAAAEVSNRPGRKRSAKSQSRRPGFYLENEAPGNVTDRDPRASRLRQLVPRFFDR
jgi:hypothetical protein